MVGVAGPQTEDLCGNVVEVVADRLYLAAYYNSVKSDVNYRYIPINEKV